MSKIRTIPLCALVDFKVWQSHDDQMVGLGRQLSAFTQVGESGAILQMIDSGLPIRYTLKSLLACILLAAVGMIAMRHESELSKRLVFTGTVTVFLVAALASLTQCGATRYFWLGFLICGFGYNILAWFKQDQLATYYLLRPVRQAIVAPRLMEGNSQGPYATVHLRSDHTLYVDGVAVDPTKLMSTIQSRRPLEVQLYVDPDVDTAESADLAKQLSRAQMMGRPGRIPPGGMTQVPVSAPSLTPSASHFYLVGHMILSLPIGMLGGLVSVWLYLRGRTVAATDDQAAR